MTMRAINQLPVPRPAILPIVPKIDACWAEGSVGNIGMIDSVITGDIFGRTVDWPETTVALGIVLITGVVVADKLTRLPRMLFSLKISDSDVSTGIETGVGVIDG